MAVVIGAGGRVQGGARVEEGGACGGGGRGGRGGGRCGLEDETLEHACGGVEEARVLVISQLLYMLEFHCSTLLRLSSGYLREAGRH